jgi:hypothetical protein
VSAPTLGIAPGVYDIADDEYHSIKTALSCSGAKRLLPPSCPAIFKWELDHGRPPKPAFDFGHAAHKQVLGVGAEIRYITAKDVKGNPSYDWSTKDAKEQRAKAYADGAIPLLEEQRGIVEGMAEALRAHPIAGLLLDPSNGKPEQSLFAVDDETGVPLRSRFDWLPNAVPGQRMIVADYKSAISSEPGAVAKAMANFGYFLQDAWYSAMVRRLGIDSDPAFVFIFQEKTAPYLVTVAELVPEAKRVGAEMMRRAIDLYAECASNDEWPGYANDVVPISLPRWFTYQYEEGA